MDPLTIAASGLGSAGLLVAAGSLYRLRTLERRLSSAESDLEATVEERVDERAAALRSDVENRIDDEAARIQSDLGGRVDDLGERVDGVERRLAVDRAGDELAELIEYIDAARELLGDPRSNEGAYVQLELLAGDVERADSTTEVVLDEPRSGAGSETTTYESAEAVADAVRSHRAVHLELVHGDPADSLSQSAILTYVSEFLAGAYEHLDTLSDQTIGVVEDRDPDLPADCRAALDRIVDAIASELLDHRDGVAVDPAEYEDEEDLALELFETFVRYDGIESDLASLDGVVERFEAAGAQR